MTKIIAAAFISLLLLMSPAHAVPSNLFKPPVCHADISTLPINMVSVYVDGVEEKQGTAFLVLEDIWATAFHVTYLGLGVDANYVIQRRDGTVTKAQLLFADPHTDVAILHAPSDGLKPIKMLSTVMELNETVWNVGFPAQTENRMMTYEGMLSRTDGIFLRSSAIALSGMSGGPQLRCHGDEIEAVAVITDTTMKVFEKVIMKQPDGSTVIHYFYQVQGSKTSPHIAKAVREVVAKLQQLE